MSLPLQAALHAANYWQALVSIAQGGNAFAAVEQIASEGGVSAESVKRKLNAACWALNSGHTFERVIEWGESETLSRWNKATREPGPRKKFVLEVAETLVDDLNLLKTELGSQGAAEWIHAQWLHQLMSRWTHNICAKCYQEKEPGREPCVLREPNCETCCFCGERNRDGIFYRADPATAKCAGRHEDGD